MKTFKIIALCATVAALGLSQGAAPAMAQLGGVTSKATGTVSGALGGSSAQAGGSTRAEADSSGTSGRAGAGTGIGLGGAGIGLDARASANASTNANTDTDADSRVSDRARAAIYGDVDSARASANAGNTGAEAAGTAAGFLDFSTLDADRTGKLTQEELTRSGRLNTQGFLGLDANGDNVVSADELNGHNFTTLDTNTDGKISQSEFGAGTAMNTATFTKLDTNHDRVLSSQELSGYVRATERP